MPAFLDTNVLIYAFADEAKTERAWDIVQPGTVVNVQVLNEFIHVMRRKSKADWSMIEEAIADILAICAPPRDLTYAIHQDAARLAAAHHLPIYDATIIAAAIEAGCDTLWSEDLQDGRCFGGLTVRNPFAAE